VFLEYLSLPGLIGERLFNIFDSSKENYINVTNFVTNLFKIYSSDFLMQLKFIFSMYDFDKDGFITKDDVRTLLSSSPIEKLIDKKIRMEGKFTKEGGGNEEYNDRLESQQQLNDMTEFNFGDKIHLSFDEFRNIVETVSSDMFLCLFVIIRQQLPSIEQFKKYQITKTHDKLPAGISPNLKVLASPKILSKFSPLSNIVKNQSLTDNLKKLT